MNAAVLYLRAIVQTFKNDSALVKHIAKCAGMNRRQRNDLAEVLASMRRKGLPFARLTGLELGSWGAAVVAILADGRPGIGAAITEEPPADLATVEALCREEAEDLEPGFLLLVIPAGVVAGGLQ
ncbi:hypothetical protein [uncultured Sphaerotilus sp.]|uniref:hypothetical protein n=1 Tax=uncultured Sphaerotilus sp. TaxID=474984 RepID=UPI0030CA3B95